VERAKEGRGRLDNGWSIDIWKTYQPQPYSFERIQSQAYLRGFWGVTIPTDINMKKPEYCTQNEGNCPNCRLVIEGRDCQNKPLESCEVTNKDDIAERRAKKLAEVYKYISSQMRYPIIRGA
jgi:hypothetical protein